MFLLYLGVWKYLNETWLDYYKKMFVSAWIDCVRNFNQHTNNRVESQHSLLKRHLNSSNNTLDAFIPFINTIVDRQMDGIKETFTRSKIMLMSNHNHPMFDGIRGKVSLNALDLLAGELDRRERLLTTRGPCGCRLYMSCGLPCACRLDNYLLTGAL